MAKIFVKDVILIAARLYGCTADEFLNNGKKLPLVRARQRAMYISRILSPENTLTSVAKAFQKSDHGTVSHAFRAVQKRMEESEEERDLVSELLRALHNVNRFTVVLYANNTLGEEVYSEHVSAIDRDHAVKLAVEQVAIKHPHPGTFSKSVKHIATFRGHCT